MFLLRPIAHVVKKFAQGGEPLLSQVFELPDVTLLDGLIQPREKAQAVVRNPCDDDAPIFRLALSRNQPARLKAVEQSRNVRVSRDQPFADFAARCTRPSCAAKDSQHVVLRRRQFRLLERLVVTPPQKFRSALDAEIDLFFPARKRLGLHQLFL